jgi:hypothetical protein
LQYRDHVRCIRIGKSNCERSEQPLSKGGTVEQTTTNFPHTITVDFGRPTICLLPSSFLRRGP